MGTFTHPPTPSPNTSTSPTQPTPNPRHTPAWFTDVDTSTLVIIDEAGKAATRDLDAVIGHALARGASVRLIGDDGQLSSISAGGVLRDIAAQTDALTLSELIRFASPAEGLASLALRAGDPAGIGHYIDHHRVHVGADATAADMAYTAWRADRDAGLESILLAPTNDTVNELNARARLDRLAAATTTVGPEREVVLSDQLRASIGDTITTRQNQRRLRLGRTDFVRNGYRYRIVGIGENGALKATHLATGHHVTLPADYVREHVTLGYAATIDAAQGLTADTCHVVAGDRLSRQLLYVALTRGRHQNHIYLSTAEADPHRVLSPKATHPDTAVDVLTRALARDDAQISATTAAREAADPFTRLAAAADMYYDALGTAAEHHLGPDTMAGIEHGAHQLRAGLIDESAWPTLRAHLAYLAAAGTDPITRLQDALAEGELANAADAAAVLDWRLDITGGHSAGIGPLQWLPDIPAALADDPQWGSYLTRRAQLVSELAEQIRLTARTWTLSTAPTWARPIVAANSELAAEVAVFRAAAAVSPDDTRLTGPEQYRARTRQIQQLLDTHATATLGRPGADTSRWHTVIDDIDARIRADAYWPQLASHLATTARTGVNVAELLDKAAAAGPLPDELPAAALWWRLAGRLGPATLDTPNARLHPPWTADLHTVFGTAIAETIIADPAWPGLVAAVAAASPQRWTPRELLHVAAEHLTDADPDQLIQPYEYARLITYTIDLFTGEHPYSQHIPTPEHPPVTPEDEEQLPPDPQLAATPDLTDVSPAPDTDHELPEPFDEYAPPDTQGAQNTEDLAGLQFEDLSTTRSTGPELKPALANVADIRTQYQNAVLLRDDLQKQIAIGHGPALDQAQAEIRELRHKADADRPYLLAVQDVVAQWHDAEEEYEAALSQVEWARTHLETLTTDPGVDTLDIASAKAT